MIIVKQAYPIEKKNKLAGFSTIELLATFTIIGMITAITLPLARSTSRAARESKLTNEIGSINRSIQLYIHMGGDLNGFTKAQPVIDTLKTSISKTAAKRVDGITGSMIDNRIVCDYGNAKKGQLCAVYNSATQQFDLTEGAKDCVLSFNLNGADDLSGLEDHYGNGVSYSGENWIWDYQDLTTMPNAETSELQRMAKSEESLKKFFDKLNNGQKSIIQATSTDQSGAYASTIND